MLALIDLASLLTPEHLIALVTLTVLEIVLGIDNIVFIAILCGRLPKEQQAKARRTGLVGALLMRVAFLMCISWIAKLTTPVTTISAFGREIAPSWRDLILLAGGLILLVKSTKEIHHSVEGGEHALTAGRGKSFGIIVGQIMLMDIVFSIDSVITAIGMAEAIEVMILAVVLSMIVMLVFAGRISDFVHRHPTVKMLALSFLILIGMSLVAEGLHFHVPKGYIYFAMAFSLGVETLNILSKAKAAREKAAGPSSH